MYSNWTHIDIFISMILVPCARQISRKHGERVLRLHWMILVHLVCRYTDWKNVIIASTYHYKATFRSAHFVPRQNLFKISNFLESLFALRQWDSASLLEATVNCVSRLFLSDFGFLYGAHFWQSRSVLSRASSILRVSLWAFFITSLISIPGSCENQCRFLQYRVFVPFLYCSKNAPN